MFELSAAIQQAIEDATADVEVAELRRAADALSESYRGPGRRSVDVSGEVEALAYAAYRAPATYAAVRRVLSEAAARMGERAPRSALDVGAGPGTATWAAVDQWPSLADVTLLERGGRFVELSRRVLESSGIAHERKLTLRQADVRETDHDLPAADLVSAAFVLGELGQDRALHVLERLWAATRDVLVVVEPGTPRGFEVILAARQRLLELGAHLLAPCPSPAPCPLAESTGWCHFAQRLPRTELHREVKYVRLGYEDQKYSYLVVGRVPGTPVTGRVLAMPKRAGGLVIVETCEDGEIRERKVSRRFGDAYRRARKLGWGDAVEEELPTT